VAEKPRVEFVFLKRRDVWDGILALLLPTLLFLVCFAISPWVTLAMMMAVTIFIVFGMPIVRLWWEDFQIRRKPPRAG